MSLLLRSSQRCVTNGVFQSTSTMSKARTNFSRTRGDKCEEGRTASKDGEEGRTAGKDGEEGSTRVPIFVEEFPSTTSRYPTQSLQFVEGV